MPFFVILAVICFAGPYAYGGELPGSIQIHGFGSQTYTFTTHNNFLGQSDGNGSFEFTEVAINSSSRPTPELQVSVQLLSRRAGKADNGDPRIDYALADYSFISGEYLRLGGRIGVVKNPMGLYNETRDASFTRPGIFLPQSIYFDRTRNIALSANGVHIYGEYRSVLGNIFLQIGAGNPRIGDSGTETAILGSNLSGSLDARVSYTGRLLYEFGGGRMRFSVTLTELNTEYSKGEPDDPLLPGEFRFQSFISSFQYNAKRFSLTSEYALRPFRFRGFGPELPDKKFTGESYYFQGEYRVFKDWGVLLRYDVVYQDRDDKKGSKFSAEFNKPTHSRFAKDFTAGLRWDVTYSVRLRAEYHSVDGTAWLTTLDNPVTGSTKRFWDMVSFLASYRF